MEYLKDIAYNTIASVFGLEDELDKKKLIEKHPELNIPKATFVTLTKQGNLRGCIGSLIPNKSLLDDIISNAKSAAFRDLRFDILNKNEIKDIEIEVSILTIPQEVIYTDIEDLKSKITVDADGVILQLGQNQSTFLPQVWQSLNTFESFFQNLCQKAGCANNCLEEHPKIYTYRVNKV